MKFKVKFKASSISAEASGAEMGEHEERLCWASYDILDTFLQRAALHGLASQDKTLPAALFYDTIGARIFEEICKVPEYYPARNWSLRRGSHYRRFINTKRQDNNFEFGGYALRICGVRPWKSGECESYKRMTIE